MRGPDEELPRPNQRKHTRRQPQLNIPAAQQVAPPTPPTTSSSSCLASPPASATQQLPPPPTPPVLGNNDFVWQPVDIGFDTRETNSFDFTARPGQKVQENLPNDPLSFVKLFLTDELIDQIVSQTNAYAEQRIVEAENNATANNTTLGDHSKFKLWKPTTRDEIHKLLGLLLLQGMIHKPTLRDYWTTDAVFSTPIFSAIMGRCRFEHLLSFLHFNDNTQAPSRTDPNRDRLHKIRPLLDHLEQKFQEVYTPEAAICIDESLILWKGRLLFRQYIPNKRKRFGVKLYALCESSTGYMYKFRVYTGRDDPNHDLDTDIQNDVPVAELLSSEKIVMWLVKPLLDQGYSVYTDNFYTSTKLANLLLSKKTHLTGTVRANRIPERLKNQSVPKGEIYTISNEDHENILYTKFHDKKDIHLLTTEHPNELEKAKDTIKPATVLAYNKWMGGVDMVDKLIEPYDATRKTIKWYRKVAVHMMQVATLNAHILYKKAGGSQAYAGFLREVIAGLLFPDPELETADDVIVPRNENLIRLSERHFPVLLGLTESDYQAKRCCRVCKRKYNRRKMVMYFCPRCPTQPGLCPSPCFQLFHTITKYWK